MIRPAYRTYRASMVVSDVGMEKRNRPAQTALSDMERGWWNKKVTVMLGPANVTYVVNNTVMAARLLLEQWPVKDGPAHRAARVECIAAMEGGDPEKARKAFEAAAREAGVLIG